RSAIVVVPSAGALGAEVVDNTKYFVGSGCASGSTEQPASSAHATAALPRHSQSPIADSREREEQDRNPNGAGLIIGYLLTAAGERPSFDIGQRLSSISASGFRRYRPAAFVWYRPAASFGFG